MKFYKSQILLSEYIVNSRADRLDEWSMDNLSNDVHKLEKKYFIAFENETNIKVGDKFLKQLYGNKYAKCEITDVIKRISTFSSDCIGVEYWAKCISGNYIGQDFEVAKSTIIRGKIE